MRDDYATATEAAKTEDKGAGKPPRVRLAIADDDPNDPPETWLDRMARSAISGLLDNARQLLLATDKMPKVEEIAHAAYTVATAMLAEKRRREKGEAEE